MSVNLPGRFDSVEAVEDFMTVPSAELVADLADTGMVLTGGTAQLRGLEGYLREQIGIPVRRDHDPERTSIRGALICLEHFDLWRESLVTDGR